MKNIPPFFRYDPPAVWLAPIKERFKSFSAVLVICLLFLPTRPAHAEGLFGAPWLYAGAGLLSWNAFRPYQNTPGFNYDLFDNRTQDVPEERGIFGIVYKQLSVKLIPFRSQGWFIATSLNYSLWSREDKENLKTRTWNYGLAVGRGIGKGFDLQLGLSKLMYHLEVSELPEEPSRGYLPGTTQVSAYYGGLTVGFETDRWRIEMESLFNQLFSSSRRNIHFLFTVRYGVL